MVDARAAGSLREVCAGTQDRSRFGAEPPGSVRYFGETRHARTDLRGTTDAKSFAATRSREKPGPAGRSIHEGGPESGIAAPSRLPGSRMGKGTIALGTKS